MNNITARVLIFRDDSCNKWAAQCLEYDIAAQGNSLQDVMKRFERTFVGNIVLALRHNEKPLATFAPAPRKYVEMWNLALALQEPMSVTIPSEELPANVLKFPDMVPRGEAYLRIAAQVVYPLAAWSWKLLSEELSRRGIEFKEEGTLRSPAAETSAIQYFENEGRRYVVAYTDRDEVIHPDVVRSVCATYGLDPKEFGLELENQDPSQQFALSQRRDRLGWHFTSALGAWIAGSNFVSPVVSPGCVKMRKLLITCEERNNYSTRLNVAVCAQLRTSADCCKNAILPLGNLRSIR